MMMLPFPVNTQIDKFSLWVIFAHFNDSKLGENLTQMSNIKNLPIMPRKKDEDYPIKIVPKYCKFLQVLRIKHTEIPVPLM